MPLQAERFETPTWARCKVHPDHHIRFGQALYSLPTRWIGCRVEVRGDRSLVRIYLHGELVATVSGFLTVGLPIDHEPTVNSNRELTVVIASGPSSCGRPPI